LKSYIRFKKTLFHGKAWIMEVKAQALYIKRGLSLKRGRKQEAKKRREYAKAV
jgi:hypothetical protein